MQTFLTDPVWSVSAANLDPKRLNKQILECGQILVALVPEIYWDIFPNGKGPSKAWRNHPAIKMWKGSEFWLTAYALRHCEAKQGAKHVLEDRFRNVFDRLEVEGVDKYPIWTERQDVIDSHRSNLLRKDREFYSQFGWNVPDNLEYVWPSKEN
jgi:hypothetical protein